MPVDEADRLEALRELDLLDSPPEERFDRVTRMAQRLFDVPIVLVSLVDSDRQWFKSCIGLGVDETGREVSFCAHAILQDEVFVVEDTLADERFADNPLVVGDPHIRFYAGHPLSEPGGHRVGTLCLIDVRPRSFSTDDAATLRDLAAFVERELGSQELRRMASALQASEEHLSAVLSSVAEGIVTYGIDGTILSFNSAAERMFGLKAAEMIGRPVWSLVGDDEAARVQPMIADRATHGEKVQREASAVRADGSRFLVHVSTSELQGSGGEVFVAVARDVTEFSRLRRRTELILNTADQGILGIDDDGRVSFVNPAAATMLGTTEAALVGAHLHDVTHHSRPDGSPYPWEECPTFQTLRHHAAVRKAEEVFVRADGTFFAVEYSSLPIGDRRGGLAGAVVTFADVTERRELDRMKDQFVSVVSHELRTPLTSVRGSLGLLASGAMMLESVPARRMLEIAVANTERLARLVDDILDLERLRAGRVDLELGPVDAASLLTTVAESLAAGATVAQVALAVDASTMTVLADADRIVQVLTNLVGNAVKFSPPGATVTLADWRVGDEVHLSVRDEGRGIPPGQLERIFLPFEQVDRRDALEKGGSGLGLAIARGIVEQHGGRIWAESEVGVGSTFVVALPALEEGAT